jgi:hypothetical protein
MIRAIAFSICLLCSMAALPTLTSSLAYYKTKHRKHRRHRRHSRRWLRRHRAMLRRQRELTAQQNQMTTDLSAKANAVNPVASSAMILPNVPGSWKRVASGSGEVRYDVQSEGRSMATAVFTRLPLSAGVSGAPRAKSLGGVPLAQMRRMVIDRMFSTGGWVVNDAVREISGQRVYVVEAACNANGAAARFGSNNDAVSHVAWHYYFTEVNGQIYSLATATTPEFAAPLAAETEQVLASLPRSSDAAGTLAAQVAK